MGNIKIEIDDKGVRKKLDDLQRNSKKVEGKNQVSFAELFNPAFMSKYTIYSNFDEMMDKSGLLKKYGDFESIDNDEWDVFVKQNTKFSNWEQMKAKAVKTWTLNKIGL